jgi:hypothetical protein
MSEVNFEGLLPEGWETLGRDGIKALFAKLAEQHKTTQSGALTFEQAMEARRIAQAMGAINAHITDQKSKLADYETATTEPTPAFADDEAEATAKADAAAGTDEAEAPVADADDDAEIAQKEFADILAKVASLGLVVRTEGGAPVTGLDALNDEFKLESDGWRVPAANGDGPQISQENFEARFIAQMQSDAPGQHTIATVNRFDPKVASLGMGSIDYNTSLIANTPEPYIEGMASAKGYATKKDPKLAAFCGPAEVIYTIPDCVDDSRSVRGLFRRVPAKRGQLEFFRTLGLADVEGLDGIAEEWTDTDQDNVVEGTFSTYKKCARITCIPTVKTQLNRLYSCVKVEILMDYGSPEIVQMWLKLISAAHARAAEERLLKTIKEKSIQLTWAGNYGSTPSLAAALIHLSAIGKFNGRLRGGRYIALVPEGMLDKMEGIDGAATGFGNYTSLRELLGRAGIGLDTLMDSADKATDMPAAYTTAFAAPGGPAVALAPAAVYGPETYGVHLITPSDGFFFELPMINTGLVSSPELARQNCKQLFMETFEGLDKNGCSPWYHILATVCHNSDRAGFNSVYC